MMLKQRKTALFCSLCLGRVEDLRHARLIQINKYSLSNLA
jgi:hypothetical protein